MSYNPKTLQALGAYWTEQGGVNLGVVGNTAHTSGYHLGKDRIYDGSGPGLGDRDYSVQLSRDKAGLTDAASAIDLGKLDGSLTELRRFSEWLVKQALAGKCRDIREIIYSTVDGVYVKRWSGPDNKVYTSLKKTADGIVTVTPGNGDSSHYTHTHISFYRDSEGRSKVPMFEPYFATQEVTDMPTLTKYLPGYTVTVKPTSNIRTAPDLQGTVIRRLTTAETWSVAGTVKGDLDGECGSDQWYTRWAGGRWEYTSACNITAGPTAPAGQDDGYTKATQDAAVAAATATLQAQVTGLEDQLAASQEAVGTAAATEKDRIAKAAGAQEDARIRAL